MQVHWHLCMCSALAIVCGKHMITLHGKCVGMTLSDGLLGVPEAPEGSGHCA